MTYSSLMTLSFFIPSICAGILFLLALVNRTKLTASTAILFATLLLAIWVPYIVHLVGGAMSLCNTILEFLALLVAVSIIAAWCIFPIVRAKSNDYPVLLTGTIGAASLILFVYVSIRAAV